MTFKDFGFDERIQRGIDDIGFETVMPVQEQCFNLLIKENRDVYAQSQTGTGKTAAFLLAIFQLLLTEEKYRGEKALVVVPTRELAVQIEREGKVLSKYLKFNIGSIYGGVGYAKQERMLADGVDILIGTPGRILDFSRQRKADLKSFGFLVVDEADRLFDMGFFPDLKRIIKRMRPFNERHTLLFSATLNTRVANLAWEYMNNPGEVFIEPEKLTVDTVTQELYHVGKGEKMKLLLGILKRDNPENGIVFTNTRHSAWEVAKRLEINNHSVIYLVGDLPQPKRLKIVDEVKKGHHKYLVATDVAARGLHIDDLEMVINYDVPLEPESYIHRIGRTARAGREGKTLTMACEEYVYGLGPIEQLLGHKIPVSWVEEDLIAEDKSEGMVFPFGARFERTTKQRSNDREQRRLRRHGERNDSFNRDGMKRVQRNKREADGRSNNPSSQKPLPGSFTKRPPNPRIASIQSAVSSVAGAGTGNRIRSTTKKSRSSKHGNDKHRYPPAQETMEEVRMSSKNSVNERLAYYREKYGEDFKLAENNTTTGSKTEKESSPVNGKQRKGILARLFKKENLS
ncbi:hypothetical protein S1OALGB6SA_1202 [Olavius algarvensis spirochete endosymbiont]|uniref:DEAD/DEAH box helicase n=1 Tax=Olavius algarvensis spirochete endosymbiont TaxID=260710 RepID=UPI000F2CD15A|nr:DEAD/DEAH box helicase [Olavius algarvensis spirochete endosymbiont]CAD7838108.1 MAG: ATP-dependent RNA helicase RhlB (EC 3.6.4.13) [Olavius algarvensis spirochete endosymbiont]VDB00128.1 hypothetical protein S1OALGB6SA_1202 [Olavius algarvensis spirochete endosymbiont]